MDAARIDGPVEAGRPGNARARASIGRLGGGLPASSLLIGAIVSMQRGAAFATELFARGGVAGTAFLRCASGRSCWWRSPARECAAAAASDLAR